MNIRLTFPKLFDGCSMKPRFERIPIAYIETPSKVHRRLIEQGFAHFSLSGRTFKISTEGATEEPPLSPSGTPLER